MAARFWVTGGTGNWNSTTNWSSTSGGPSGNTVPGSGDTAAIDANSGSGTVTLDISPTVQTLTMTGFTGTLAFGANTITLNSTGTIFTGATTMTVTGTPLIICTATVTTTARTINPTAVTEANSVSFRITNSTANLTFGAGAIRGIDFTDGTNPTGYGGTLATFVVTIYGDIKFSTNMSVSSSTNTMTFAATSGTKTINTAGLTIDRQFTFNGVGGTFQLAADLTSGATRTCTLTTGTLDLNGYTLTIGLFASNNGNTRAIAFGTGKIVLTGNTATVWTNATATGFTYTGTSRIEAPGPATTGIRTFNPGTVATSTEATALSFYITGGSDTVTFSATSRRVNILDFTGFTGTLTNSNLTVHGNYTLAASPMVVGSGALLTTFAATSSQNITTNAQTLDFPVTFDGIGGTFQLAADLTSGATRTCTLTNGTLDLASYTLTTGAFSSTNSNTRTLAFGTGKIVLTGNNTSIFANGTATGFTYTGTSRIEAPGPATTGTRTISLATTTTSTQATALNIYVTAGSDTLDFLSSNRRVNTLDFTGFSGTFNNAFLTVHGGYTLAASPMVVGSGALLTTFATTTSQNITTNAQTLDFPVTFDGIGGTWEMQDALTLGSTQPLTLTNGTLKLKSGTTNTVGSFVTTGTTQKFLSATTPGSQATLSDASGTNSVSYLTIQDSAATGGAVFQSYLSNLNVNSGNNTGWNFGNVIAGNVITETATGTDTVASIATFFNSLQETATGTDAMNGRPLWEVIDDTQTANWTIIPTT